MREPSFSDEHLPPGPLRTLMTELRELHRRAGRPGLRRLAGRTFGGDTFTYGAVHTLFTRSFLPEHDNPARVHHPNDPILMAVVESLAARVKGLDVDATCEKFSRLCYQAEEYLRLFPTAFSELPKGTGPPSLPNPLKSRAVLIGASQFSSSNMPPLPTVAHGLHEFADALTGPLGQFRPDHTRVLQNPAHASSLLSSIEDAARQADDTLLVYYAGHGMVSSGGQLHLASSDTRPGADFTAAPYDSLRTLISTSRASRKLVILDCCYSGRAVTYMGDDHGATEIPSSYVLAATDRYGYATAQAGSDAMTAFTGTLLRVLAEGIPDGPELLDVPTIHHAISDRMIRQALPKPGVLGIDGDHPLALQPNPATQSRPRATKT
jgi:hypothetical protein